MTPLKELSSHIDKTLELWRYSADKSNNGLQFEGAPEVRKAVFGVDACAALFRKAAEAQADFVFVHHGMSWGSSLKRIQGIDASRLGVLAKNSISLYAAHLPLDAHPKLGNNAVIAKLLDLQGVHPFAEYSGAKIGCQGELRAPSSPLELANSLDMKLPSNGAFRIFGSDSRKIKRVGVVSGGGCWPELMDEMLDDGVECLITGEVEHEAWNAIMEAGVPVVAMGHYRSETTGVLALKEEIENRFSLPCEFIDLPSGL